MNHQIIYIPIILLIIFFQLKTFINTRKKIKQLKVAIPIRGDLRIVPYKGDGTDKEKDGVLLITTTNKNEGDIWNNIGTAINQYLYNNSDSVNDFNLIRDIVDRNCDAETEEINTLLPIPLYLGLMGTMFGIVVGIGSLALLGDENIVNNSTGLMMDVAIAMTVSAVGLLLTTISSGWYYKKAKSETERKKNDLYTFIQTELMPSLSTNVIDNAIILQESFHNFNAAFTSNMNRFEPMLRAVLNTANTEINLIEKQAQFMHELKEIDVRKIARLNIDVLQELSKSMAEFEKFNICFGKINTFVDSAEKLNSSLNNQLTRTEFVVEIAETIKNTVNSNSEIAQLLKADTKYVDNYIDYKKDRENEMREIIGDVDNVMKKAVTELKDSLNENLRAFREFAIQEEDSMRKVFEEKKNNFDELQKLSSVKSSLEKIEILSSKQDSKLDNLNSSINRLCNILEQNNKSARQDSKSNKSNSSENKANGSMKKEYQSTQQESKSNESNSSKDKTNKPTKKNNQRLWNYIKSLFAKKTVADDVTESVTQENQEQNVEK